MAILRGSSIRKHKILGYNNNHGPQQGDSSVMHPPSRVKIPLLWSFFIRRRSVETLLGFKQIVSESSCLVGDMATIFLVTCQGRKRLSWASNCDNWVPIPRSWWVWRVVHLAQNGLVYDPKNSSKSFPGPQVLTHAWELPWHYEGCEQHSKLNWTSTCG